MTTPGKLPPGQTARVPPRKRSQQVPHNPAPPMRWALLREAIRRKREGEAA